MPLVASIMQRRDFIKTTVLSSIGFPAITSVASPNSLLNIAAIGVGGMGLATIRSIAKHSSARFTALCDVDNRHLEAAAKTYPQASKHIDWREMLQRESSHFDAVVIATPDHQHAGPCVTALRAKKHVYLQKPMAPSVHECRVIREEAQKAQVITQLGNQGKSAISNRMTIELLRNGAIGKVREIRIWENKDLSWWPKVSQYPDGSQQAPSYLNWPLWLGPRKHLAYQEQSFHTMHWRAWKPFGVGELGDMGCHHFDNGITALELEAPLRVRQIRSDQLSSHLWAKSREVEFEFAPTPYTHAEGCKLTWVDADFTFESQLITKPKELQKMPIQGAYYIGEKGNLFQPYLGRPYLLPEEQYAPEIYPRDLPPQDHYTDWVNAILKNQTTNSHFDHGSHLTEVVIVGTLAEQAPGEWVEWNAKTQQTNHPHINAKLIPIYETGWNVEGLA